LSTIADLLIKVRADTGGAEKDIKSFGSKVGGGFQKALLPATAALGVMGVVGKAAFDNLQDGARNAKQTDAVIKSTGDASNVTAKHVDDLAMSLRRKAGVDDDVVHAGENMLLTFTNIRNEAGKGNDIFDQTTKTMLDMSHALGQSTTTSALQLGKALNDPVRGMTALQRVGVSFTEAQKKQVKAMVDSGHAMGAQKLILHELNKEFGGSATNIDPTTKAIANMKLDAVDLASSLLSSLMPALQTFVGLLQGATSFMTAHEKATKIVVTVIGALAVGVIAVNLAMKLYTAGALAVRAATAVWTAAQWLLNAALSANPIGLVILALVALGVMLAVLWTKSETFRNIVTGAWNAIKSTTLAVFNGIVAFFRQWWPILLIVATGGLGLIVALIVSKWDAIKSATSSVWNALKGIVVGAVNAVQGAASSGFNAVASVVTGAVDRVRAAVSGVFGALAGIVKGAVAGIQAGIGGIVGAFGAIVNILRDIVGGAEAAFGAIDKVAGVASKVGGVGGKVLHALHVPGFASGVRNFGGGLAVVGENGPELVNLPGGSDVHTNADTREMLAGGGSNVGGGDVVLVLDGEVLARFTRRELDRTGKRNVNLTFGSA
jgi:hypothetical protein